MLEAIPFWVYFAVAGILLSAYMVIKTTREEQEIDQAFIEEEGQVYIERMENERAKRRGVQAGE